MQYAIAIIKVILIASVVLSLVPLLIWWERKGAAYIQDRRGPNRANIFGVRLGGFIHNFADMIKLLFKEDIIPTNAHRVLYLAAPMIALCVAVLTVAVIPMAAPINIGGINISFQIANLNIGILYILAVASLGVYGVMLAGWSSGNTYSLLGGLRASAQMISYEVATGLALLSVLIYAGSVRLDEIVALQGSSPLDWNFARQPLAFILFLTGLFAEANRNPFDLPEGESEIVAGYHVEYSSMKFAMFFMAEYAHIILGSMILVSLFFGGWQVPMLSTSILREHMGLVLKPIVIVAAVVLLWGGLRLTARTKKFGWGDLRDYEPALFGVPMTLTGIVLIGVILSGILCGLPAWTIDILTPLTQLATFFAKVLFWCWFFIWVRWTLPRFRYDQLMRLGWKIMIPLAIINITITVFLIR